MALNAAATSASPARRHRILPIDQDVATTWAQVTLTHRAANRTVNPIDELIAATALAHHLTVVTRNARDFEASGCEVVVPWG